MWRIVPCSLRKLSGMVRCTVVRTVEHYQCGAVRVHYINSREWSDVLVRRTGRTYWSDVLVGRTSDYCHLWGSLRLAPNIHCILTSIVYHVIFDRTSCVRFLKRNLWCDVSVNFVFTIQTEYGHCALASVGLAQAHHSKSRR